MAWLTSAPTITAVSASISGLPSLALHGVVCREDGTTVTITIGENDEDPVFTITDLLPHLGREQNQKKLPDAITAENLNVVLGSLPIADADAETASS